MSGKVIHVPDKLHERFKKLAEERGVSMRDLLEQLIQEGANKIAKIPTKAQTKSLTVQKITIAPRPKEKPEPVKKKSLMPVKAYDKEVADAVNQPPFWQDRGP